MFSESIAAVLILAESAVMRTVRSISFLGSYLRSLLIECANHILRPRGKDSSLRRWGLHLAEREGKQAKNKAVVAVARKLAVLLHHIWTTQEAYMPSYTDTA